MSEIDFRLLYLICFERKFKMVVEELDNTFFYDDKLEDPYSEEELTKCLNKKNIKIPLTLFHYLTKVSREFVFEMYPTPILLDNLPTKEDIETSYIDDNKNSFTHKDLNIHYKNMHKASITLGILGCGYEVFLYIGNGPRFGTIWNDNVHDGYSFKENSIEDYIKYNMNLFI
jgi:hypothetical protein